MGRNEWKVSKAAKEAIYKLARRGCSDEEIASAIGISRPTFSKHKFTFFDELKKGRFEGEPINIDKVENALLKKACGFEYKETTEEPYYVKKDGYIAIDEEKEMRVTKVITKQVIPSDQAIFFYLVNRKKERWHSINNQIITDLGEDAEQYFKQIAAEIKKSDTNTD